MAFNAFLKIDGIVGESTDKLHKGEIEISSFSWGVENTSSVRGSGGGAPSPQDFNFTANLSLASPSLMLACASGKHFDKCSLTVRKAGVPTQLEYLKVTLLDCLVSSYQSGGTATEAVPTEEFSLNFAKIDFYYKSPKTRRIDETVFNFAPAGTP